VGLLNPSRVENTRRGSIPLPSAMNKRMRVELEWFQRLSHKQNDVGSIPTPATNLGRAVTKKRWSAMEMAYLQDSWEKDVPIEAIAGHLKRTVGACREKLHRMAIRRAVGQWLR
jgi:hypothetical protein